VNILQAFYDKHQDSTQYTLRVMLTSNTLFLPIHENKVHDLIGRNGENMSNISKNKRKYQTY